MIWDPTQFNPTNFADGTLFRANYDLHESSFKNCNLKMKRKNVLRLGSIKACIVILILTSIWIFIWIFLCILTCKFLWKRCCCWSHFFLSFSCYQLFQFFAFFLVYSKNNLILFFVFVVFLFVLFLLLQYITYQDNLNND